MTTTATTRCDGHGCDHQKAATNHWWKLRITLAEKDGRLLLLILRPWSAESEITASGFAASKVKDFELCGEDCLIRTISQLLKGSA